MFDCIVPLGKTCLISFLMENAKLRNETSLFEWFVVNSLQTITTIIENAALNTQPQISVRNDGNVGVQIIDMNMYSGHYSVDEYIPKYGRRASRFIETIRSNSRILFLRYEDGELPQQKEVDDFVTTLRNINPDLEIKVVLVRSSNKKESDIRFDHPILNYEYIPNEYISTDDILCKREPINTWFQSLVLSYS
jgi:hypothetical protein